jgi:hypothetical protein
VLLAFSFHSLTHQKIEWRRTKKGRTKAISEAKLCVGDGQFLVSINKTFDPLEKAKKTSQNKSVFFVVVLGEEGGKIQMTFAFLQKDFFC